MGHSIIDGHLLDNNFFPGIPDGRNQTLDIPLSHNGILESGRCYTVPARCGVAVLLKKGQTISLINDYGTQVCDLWAFNERNLHESLSMEHTRTHIGRLTPRVGDVLVSNRRTRMLELTEDSSPGVHDTLIAACDINRYQQLGVKGYHDNCSDNLRMAMLAIGKSVTHIPSPFNVWMNVTIGSEGGLNFHPPLSRKNDKLSLKSLSSCYIVISCCPQDITEVNGSEKETKSISIIIEG